MFGNAQQAGELFILDAFQCGKTAWPGQAPTLGRSLAHCQYWSIYAILSNAAAPSLGKLYCLHELSSVISELLLLNDKACYQLVFLIHVLICNRKEDFLTTMSSYDGRRKDFLYCGNLVWEGRQLTMPTL